MTLTAENLEHSYDRDEVIKIINSVIHKVEENEGVSRDAIHAQLKELRAIIDEARQEIGRTGATDISDKHIPTATDELDAVVESTAEATGTIMDCCEVIQENAAAIGGENAAAIEAEVIKIFEACSFQDITGQRITKVVSSLKAIEEKVNKLLGFIGKKGSVGEEESSAASPPPTREEDTRTGDEALLNGPQMPDQAISQDDIDKILSEFD